MTFDKNIHSTLRLMLKTLLAKNYRLRKEVNARIKTKTITESYMKELLDGKYEMFDATDEYIKEINQCKGACLLPVIKIPNEINGKPSNYFFKLSQELNKNSRVSAFIINPQLLIPDISYYLHDHEIVLLSEMVHSYYEHLQEPKRLPQYTTYDTAGIDSMFIKLYYITIIININHILHLNVHRLHHRDSRTFASPLRLIVRARNLLRATKDLRRRSLACDLTDAPRRIVPNPRVWIDSLNTPVRPLRIARTNARAIPDQLHDLYDTAACASTSA
jgi:hypothetical protein